MNDDAEPTADDDRRVLHVDIRPFEDALRDAREDFVRAYEGGEAEPRHRLTFDSPEQFQEVFNATNLTLLRAISRERPESIRAVARLVDRSVSRVHGDLETLAEYGLVEFEAGDGRAKRPVVPYDEIRIDVGLDGVDDGDPVTAAG